jgi:integrase
MPSNIIPIRKAADKPKPKAREAALEHLQAALETGVRGAFRDAILAAIDTGASPKSRDLSSLQYESLRPGQKLVDPRRPGFLARSSARGVRFVYRHNDPQTGKRTETTIGYLGSVTLADAREQWKEMRARRMTGEPVAEDVKSPEAPALTVRELAQRYLSDYSEKVKRSWKDDERLLNKHVLPTYGDLPATELTAEQVQTLLAGLADTPREVQKVRAVLQTMFNVACGKTRKLTLAETWLPRGHPNPVTNVQVADHKASIHIPSEAEMRAYHRSLATSTDIRPDLRDVLLLQVLTACRINEVVGARWQEFDLEHGKWHIPGARVKNGDAHTVLLSKQALKLLKRRQDTAASAYVFPSPTSHKRAVRSETVQGALAEHRQALGVGERFTSHAVRHAFMTWAGERGYPVEVRNRVTAHRMTSGIDARYNHAELNKPAGECWQAWADWLSG